MLGRYKRHRTFVHAGRLAATVALAACSSTKSTPPADVSHVALGTPNPLDQPLDGPPRLFHTTVDDAFWVSHSPDRDRLISQGVRLEVSATNGEVFAATWETEGESKGEPLVGALEVPTRLGGGFVHWSRNLLFRSDTFTGPLHPIAIKHALANEGIRGARSGLDGVVVFGESANATLRAGKMALDPPPFVGLLDFAALDDKHAVRIDMLGRAYTTIDGGKTWTDATGIVGISLKQLLVESDALSVTTWQGRFRFNDDGTLGPLETAFLGARRNVQFGTIFRGSRAEDTNAWWTWREIAPMQAAVLGGARTDATHALGMATGALGVMDLAKGELVRAITDWPQAGLSCSTIAGFSEPLFVCGWDAYQGYGSYVLHANHGEWPPVIEHVFTDDSYYVTDDHGALGFVGACSATPKYLDPNDTSRFDVMGEAFRVATKICVRRSATEWVEHEVSVDDDSIVQAWAAKRDGTAVAFVVRKDGVLLPDLAEGPPRVTNQGGVRVIRVPRDLGGFGLARPNWNPYGNSGRTPAGPLVERRIRVQQDGGISAWFSPTNNSDPSSGVHMGGLIDKRGDVTLFPPPPRTQTMIASSEYGVALLADGTLAETLNHGRTYRPGGLSPVPPSGFNGYCTQLGCVLGPITRLGWGAPATNPTVHTTRLDEKKPPKSSVRIDCLSYGTPEVIDDKFLHKGNRQAWLTSSGDGISLVREVENLPDDAPQVLPPQQGPDDAPPEIVAPQKKSFRPPTRTQSLLVRTPFDPDALPKRLDATSSGLDNVRRLGVISLLGKDGDVGLLLITDKHEVFVLGEDVTMLPLFEQRRYLSDDARHPPGLVLGPNHGLILGDIRRRSALEEHGFGTQRAPVYVGHERDSSTRKPMTLARREDGTQGLIVWEGSPARTAAVSELDEKSHTFQAFTNLAPWTTATMGDDPRCKNMRGWTALVPIDPTLWFDLDAFSANGTSMSSLGMVLVRWSSERLCIDAMDVGIDPRGGYDWRYDDRLVVRWLDAGKKRRGGALLQNGTRRKAECRLVSTNDAQKP